MFSGIGTSLSWYGVGESEVAVGSEDIRASQSMSVVSVTKGVVTCGDTEIRDN